jgi:lauroyl/myristoyl acyltransferase
MADSLRRLRRAATQLTIRQAIRTAAVLPIGPQRSAVRSLVALGGNIPMLRRRVRDNMRLALGEDVPKDAERLYFRRLGWYLSNSLATFNHGIAAAHVLDEVTFDASVEEFDAAVAGGRGAILVTAHWCGHELVSAMIHRRHPMPYLVRQASTAERTAQKLKWYKALGVETVLRPSHASTIKDAVAYLNVLKQGKVLGITPDLLADPGQGVETRLFGRSAQLRGGAFAIAIAARVPMVRLHFRWLSDTNVQPIFERAPLLYDSRDRDMAIRAAVQDWSNWFEERLRANPENWQFWLDKRWTRFLRATPRTVNPA